MHYYKIYKLVYYRHLKMFGKELVCIRYMKKEALQMIKTHPGYFISK